MPTRFDHLVIAVDDLDAAIGRWSDADLPAVRGGRHPGGTENALIRGPGPGYVELIAAAPQASGPWADRVRAHPGPLSWAIAVDDLVATRAAVVAAGFEPGEIADGSRITPNGDTIRWRMLQVGAEPLDSELPFLIHWVQPMAPGPAEGPVITSLDITVEDDARLRRLLVAVGLVEDPDWPNSFAEPPDADRPIHRRGVRISISRADGRIDLPEQRPGRIVAVAEAERDPGRARVDLDLAEGAGDGGLLDVLLDDVGISGSLDLRAHPAAYLIPAVEERFADRDPALGRWPDPHLGQAEDDEDEYSRVTDEPRYRIVAARVRAWLEVLTDHGLATVSMPKPGEVVWDGERDWPPASAEVTVAEPAATGAAALVVGSRTDFPCVHLGAGTPVVPLVLIPDCGCDHCDTGSDDLLVQIDETIMHVLGGGLVHLRRDGSTATTGFDGSDAGSGSAAGRLMAQLPVVAAGGRVEADRILVGRSWLT